MLKPEKIFSSILSINISMVALKTTNIFVKALFLECHKTGHISRFNATFLAYD